MKTKNEVYVVVNTPKKAKKLKKLLDMFGEKYGGCTFELLENKEGDKVYFNMGSEWHVAFTFNCEERCKQVSIKELRNILAKEHLKGGDVVVMRSRVFGKILLEVRGMDGEKIDIKNELYVDEGSRFNYGTEIIGGIDFIRYATEEEILLLNGEEKALLEPKRQLEVGKWYVLVYEDREALIFNVDGIIGYGFGWNGAWVNEFHTCNVLKFEQTFKEATAKEVEKALIEEAKRRGIAKGCVTNNSNIHGSKYQNATLLVEPKFEYSNMLNCLSLVIDSESTRTIFKNGQWATIIEQPQRSEDVDKFAELKEAHMSGAVIQFRNEFTNYEWRDCSCNNPTWDTDNEYRIKPEVEPKLILNIGDVVKLNNSQVAVVKDPEEAFRWRFCTKLSKEEVIDLLFNE